MQQEGQGLRIGDLGKATGTKVETIRYYEQISLLPVAERTETGNYRTYTPRHVERLGFIRRARALGFTLDQVRALLGLADHKD
jgi:DNA-binding transcriptional MerR regulator